MAALPFEKRKVTLAEVIDRVLHKGAVITGEVTISVADIDLVRLGLRLVLASAGTLSEGLEEEEEAARVPRE